MKYSPIPTYVGAFIIFLFQLSEKGIATKNDVDFIGVIILLAISITIVTAKEKK